MNVWKDLKMLQSWKKTKSHLQNAFSFLSISGSNENELQIIKDYEEFLRENELELAFDQLEELALTIVPPKEFWKEMYSAAKQMGLEKHAEHCKAHFD